ncbi:MAG: TOBE domain-containing protein, partial [Pseudomonadota bacterium]
LGADSFLVVDCGELGQITVRTTGDTGLSAGETVGLVFDEERLTFFDENGQSI